MDSSIFIEDKGYCVYRHYNNYVLGKYSLRTMRNGRTDIYFHGFLIGENGFNPYSYILQTSIDEFESDKIKIGSVFYEIIYARLDSFFHTLQIILNSQIQNPYKEDCKSYIYVNSSNSFTLGIKKDEVHFSYDTVFIQKREDGITIKIKKGDLFGSPEYLTDGRLSSIYPSLYEGIRASITSQAQVLIKKIEDHIKNQ